MDCEVIHNKWKVKRSQLDFSRIVTITPSHWITYYWDSIGLRLMPGKLPSKIIIKVLQLSVNREFKGQGISKTVLETFNEINISPTVLWSSKVWPSKN